MPPLLLYAEPCSSAAARKPTPRSCRNRLAAAMVVLLALVSATAVWNKVRSVAELTRADIVFVIDATGSMADEIDDVRMSLMAIGNGLANRKPKPDVRFGAVFYRDVVDKELVREIPLTTNLPAVREAIMDVKAEGGGDWPEHVGIGLHKALEMDWSHSEGGVRLVYLVADAPPQNYDDGYDISSALSIAKRMNVKINVIGCSGLDSGTASMQDIASGTKGTFSHFDRQHTDQRGTRPSRGHASGFHTERDSFSRGGTTTTSTTMHSASSSSRHREASKVEGAFVGIDLGTTTSAIGFYKHGRVEIIPNERGNRMTPSHVAVANGKLLVGESAKSHLDLNATQVISALNLGPEEKSAILLRKLKQDAEHYLSEPVKRAIIAVPASYNERQRQATLDAGTIAGFDVVRLLNKPTAAAIAYGFEKKFEHEQHILVYDLGGGTFDVSLLLIDNGIFEVLATAVDSNLGGENQRVLQHMLRVFGSRTGEDLTKNVNAIQKIKRAVDEAQVALSSSSSVQIEVQDLLPGVDLAETLTQSQVNTLNADLFNSTLQNVQRVLDDSGVEKNQVDEVLLVGGGHRTAMVRSMLQDFFHGKEIRDLESNEAIAHGAAVQAGVLGGGSPHDLLLLDVAPLTLGIEWNNGSMAQLIRRNTVIPTKKEMVMSTSVDNQPSLNIKVFEGEHLMVTDNNLLGIFAIDSLAPAPAGWAQIDVTFEIDGNGIFHVSAQDRSTAKSEKTTVMHDKGRLSEEQLEKLLRDMPKEGKIIANASDPRSEELAERESLDADTSSDIKPGNIDLADSNVIGPPSHENDGSKAEYHEMHMGRLSEMIFESVLDEL